LKRALLLIAFALSPCAGYAEGLETTHIFGFTIGTDVNQVGEIEGEIESIGRFGKSAGTCAARSRDSGHQAPSTKPVARDRAPRSGLSATLAVSVRWIVLFGADVMPVPPFSVARRPIVEQPGTAPI